MSTSTARQKFSEIVSKAEFAGERTVLQRRRKPVAAVVPIHDLMLLERLENEADVRAARAARAEKGSIPWSKIRKEHGL